MIMEMPTPCPTCDRIVELNDMNACGFCDALLCNQCCKVQRGDCEDCKAKYRCEYTFEAGKNVGIECGEFAPYKIEDIRCCARHEKIIERRLQL